MDIISASDRQALSAGLAALGGAVSEKCGRIRDELKFAAATVAAFSDFPDEEPEFSGIDKLGELLENAACRLGTLYIGLRYRTYDKNGINTVIIGRPTPESQPL